MAEYKKQIWKPGNMLYPLPVVMVSVADGSGKKNIITVAWTGTVCSDPPMVSISVRPERYSYQMIQETGEFVINLATKELAIMKAFMDKDFLLETPTAQHLYHDYAETLPIVDYHCHIPPQEIYEDRRFENIAQVWLGGHQVLADGSDYYFGDHYKWRVMRSKR